jgi:hypothetical protein
MALTQAREIDAILAIEWSGWSPNIQDLVLTLGQRPQVEGLRPYPSTASGKLFRTIMAGLREFERDFIQGRGNMHVLGTSRLRQNLAPS